MDCLDADSVTALLGGTLDAETREQIDDHVDSCERCRQWIAAAARDHARRETLPRGESATVPDTGARHVMLTPGAKVGRYVVEDFLGAGAMGVVYAARDPQLDRTIALKVVAIGSAHDGETRALRLVREAQAMARVSHPNVVAIYDAGQDAGLVFIAMQRIDGAPLRRYLETHQLSRGERLRLLCGAGRGLAAAHAAGIVHRDFKPDNVLVDTEGTAKVGDFGLAAMGVEASERRRAPVARGRERADYDIVAEGSPTGDAFATAEGTILGTPAYMAPEVKAGTRADVRSDQYSFALTVAEALGDDPPRRIRKALDRARAEDPAQRYGSIAELVRALEQPPIVLPVAAAAAVAAITWIAWPAHADAGAACDAEPYQQLAQVLSPTDEAMLRTQLAKLSPIYARDAMLAADRVHDYSAKWIATSQAACRATKVSGQQPADVYELVRGCLDERLDEIKITRDALRMLDDKHAGVAPRLSSSLVDLEHCSDVRGLRIANPNGKARELRTKLVEIHTLLEEGYADKAEPQLDALLAEARAANLPAVEGAILLSKSSLLARTHRPGGDEGFHQALAIADRIGDLELRVDALNALLADAAIDKARWSEVELLAKMIDDTLANLPGKQLRRRGIEQGNLSNYYETRQDFPKAERAAEAAYQAFREEVGATHPYTVMARDEAAHIQATETHYDKAIAIEEALLAELHQAYGAEHPMLARAELSLGTYYAFAQRLDEGLAAFRRSLAISEHLFGPNHPEVAQALRKIAFIELDKHPAEARDAFARAIDIVERATHIKDNPELIPMLVGLGDAELASGDPANAVATFERAFTVWGDTRVFEHLRPDAQYGLARALWDSGGDKRRAKKLAEDARAGYLANQGPWLPKADEVQKWLKTHS